MSPFLLVYAVLSILQQTIEPFNLYWFLMNILIREIINMNMNQIQRYLINMNNLVIVFYTKHWGVEIWICNLKYKSLDLNKDVSI
jgi:hypothetical protein